ncbi:MAG: hypothetical protein OXN96_21285, partial [Bryobacterales bacterium]|nr:hypothetical protein [Bryobacterales bacterium]
GIIQVEWRENGRRLTRSLKHRDWDRAKRQADKIAAGLAEPTTTDTAEAKSESLTLETLFDIYGDEVTPTKSKRSRNHDRAMMRRFLRFFGKHRKPETLSQRDWDRFIRARRAGRAGGSRRPVSERTIEYDLRLLLAVLNWAAKSRDEEGRLLLESTRSGASSCPRKRIRGEWCLPKPSTRRCSGCPPKWTGGSEWLWCSPTRPGSRSRTTQITTGNHVSSTRTARSAASCR